jgi:Fe-S oxidoreductase
VEEADEAAAATRSDLDGDLPLVLLDPHCRPEVQEAVDGPVTDLVTLLADLVEDGRLDLAGAPSALRWHEPCLLVGTPAAGRGPAVLAAAGALVELPGEAHHGCSGGGLGLPLLDPDAAEEVAAQRRATLAGPGPLVTACAGAAARLSDGDEPVRHLVEVLADLLDDDPESVA